VLKIYKNVQVLAGGFAQRSKLDHEGLYEVEFVSTLAEPFVSGILSL
jgi:hypothetical protein